MDITGKIYQIGTSLSGVGQNGTWRKQEFVIETMDQYPKRICIEAWNDDVRLLETLQPGNVVKVFFNVESREYEGKWYTQCRMWKLNVIGR